MSLSAYPPVFFACVAAFGQHYDPSKNWHITSLYIIVLSNFFFLVNNYFANFNLVNYWHLF